MANILVIDDDAEMRKMFRVMLERSGHHVQLAQNGTEGLRCYMRQPFDIIISDVFMPKMSGIDVIRAIMKTNTQAKIIALSGGGINSGAKTYLEMAMQLGAAYIFTKPFARQEMLSAVEKLLTIS